jgi:type IX secretion system PorP/SprF family membrane protein
MGIKPVLLILLVFTCIRTKAQDPVFSQFYAAPLQINPAFAGVADAPRISVNYRDQWPSWPNAYRTYSIGFEQRLPDGAGGLGLQVLADDAGNGLYRTMAFHGSYSYHLQVNADYFLKFGLEAGILQSRLDWDQLVFGDQLNPVDGNAGGGTVSEEARPAGLAAAAVDIGAGLLLHNSRAYLGISARHLNRPEENFISANEGLRVGRPMRLTAHAGLQFGFAEGNNLKYPSFISPNLLFIRQADFVQINAGTYLSYQAMFGGVWYRHSGGNPDAAIALIGVREGIFRFGYSYDLTISPLGGQRTGGAHEISMTLNFEDSRARQKRRKSAQYNDCFKMFR